MKHDYTMAIIVVALFAWLSIDSISSGESADCIDNHEITTEQLDDITADVRWLIDKRKEDDHSGQ